MKLPIEDRLALVSLLTGEETVGTFTGHTFYKKSADGYLLVYNGETEETAVSVPETEKAYTPLMGTVEGNFTTTGALSLRLPAGGYCFLKATDEQIPAFLQGKKALYVRRNGRLELLRLIDASETRLPVISGTGPYILKGFQWEETLVPLAEETTYTFFARQ